MKKISLILLAVLAFSSSALTVNSCGNSTSSATNTVVHDTVYRHYWDPEQSGVTSMLIAVRFSTLKIGTAVGVGGAIVRTTDGGESWSSQFSGVNADLYGVSFGDINTGIAVGSSGVVIRTIDGGSNWQPLDVNSDVQFRNVQMVGPQTAYVAGARYISVDNTQGYVYKTTDGGLHWTELTLDSPPGLYGISFTDANNGWVSGHHGSIYHTSDGGTTWSKQNSTIPNDYQVTQVSFADASHGIAVSVNSTAGIPGIPNTGFIATTSDGGTTWTKMVSNPLSGLWMSDVNHAAAVGYSGTVMETADGGASWTTKSVSSLRLLNVFMNDADNGAIVGEDGKLYILGPH